MTAKRTSMSLPKKILLWGGAIFLLLLVIGAVAPPPAEKEASTKELVQSASNKAEDESTDKSEESKKPEAKIETKMVEETKEVPFATVTEYDASLPQGQVVVTAPGVKGKKVIVYEVTYNEGKETGRKRMSEQITQEPTDKVKKIGTKVAAAPKPAPKPKPAGNCHPNYSGCVPIASDVDCAGGSGNGPAYVRGPITVRGADVYRLDADHDGIACE